VKTNIISLSIELTRTQIRYIIISGYINIDKLCHHNPNLACIVRWRYFRFLSQHLPDPSMHMACKPNPKYYDNCTWGCYLKKFWPRRIVVNSADVRCKQTLQSAEWNSAFNQEYRERQEQSGNKRVGFQFLSLLRWCFSLLQHCFSLLGRFFSLLERFFSFSNWLEAINLPISEAGKKPTVSITCASRPSTSSIYSFISFLYGSNFSADIP